MYQQAVTNITEVTDETAVQQQRIAVAKATVSVGHEDISRTTASVGSVQEEYSAATARLAEAKS